MRERLDMEDSSNILPMRVANIGFLLDRLGQDCHPLQFLRELTQNSIEAIQRLGEPGQIIWDVDWNLYSLEGVQKLCITDNGTGMTGEEMVRFINQLSSSVSEQSMSGNYGIGAKISAATRNREGVIYISWKNGLGSMIQLYRDADTGQYGLKQWQREDGTYGHFLELDDEAKPDSIIDHGTMVVLLGNSEVENTMRAPKGVASPSRWVSKYLNSRYFKFPAGIKIRAREGWEFSKEDKDRNYLRTLTGQEEYLNNHAETSGHLDLTGATAHWWILQDEPAIGNNSGFVESAGHMAALYQDELYELAGSRAGMCRLQQFGVTFGYKWVVIYIEPLCSAENTVTTNTARTSLLLDNEPLPWSEWATEFREKMPPEIREFVQSKAAASSSTDHTKSIRERLREIMNLYKISRYRPNPSSELLIDDEQMITGTTAKIHQRKRIFRRTGSYRGGTGGNLYSIFEKREGIRGSKVSADLFPDVKWVTLKNGTREPGNIEDRSAKYLADQNLLLINADFRLFDDMANHYRGEIGGLPGISDTVIEEAVHGWFEQALVETVIGVQALRGSKEWRDDHLEAALSEEALTAAVMQRYHINVAVRRELGSKVGSLKTLRA